MKALNIKSSPAVDQVFYNYPKEVRDKILHTAEATRVLRKLILDTANEVENTTDLEETLKWGEPSYITKNGSTIRIAWQKKKPEQYGMYFTCTTKLVPTFKALFDDQFTFDGNRAILFKMEDEIPEEELKLCIAAALQYHKVKQEENLGIRV